MRYLFSVGLLVALACLAFRSTSSYIVQGQVLAAGSGKPIAGAAVSIKGSSAGSLSTTDGHFSISADREPCVLVCSAVGYDPAKIKITNDGKSLQIKLKAISSRLEEVVVTGNSKRANDDETIDYEKSVPAVVNRSPILSKLQGRSSGIASQAGLPRGTMRDKQAYKPDADASWNREGYDGYTENPFLRATDNPLSTFSIDVDGAAYSNVRRFLNAGQLPPAGAVRIEELINYFHYEYPQPVGNDPFSINTEMAPCPWNIQNKLLLIGLQGKKIPVENLPACNLVFLIDVSGSMLEPDKLPLVQASLKLLVDQLRAGDRVSLVVYAGNAGLVMPSTSGSEKEKIKTAIDQLEAGGSTAGGEGIQLAYKTAMDHFQAGGNNRVILCTDGDFNVGVSSDAALEKLIERERNSGVYLTVLGFGTGNYQDSKMQKLADKGNGNHSYIDNLNEARKVLVNEFGGTLFTIAKDVKLQLEFNGAKVQAYRLIGYEKRLLNKEDFNDDQKDAGDLGSGHTVTAIYEIVPVGVRCDFLKTVDPLKYQPAPKRRIFTEGNEWLTIKFRYKKPEADISRLIVHPVDGIPMTLEATSDNFRFAAAVAQFGMLLGHSQFSEQSSFANAMRLAQGSKGADAPGYRTEFISLLSTAKKLSRGVENPPVETPEEPTR